MPEAKESQGQGRPIHLTICVPSTDYWPADFALSLMALQQYLGYHPLSDDFKHNLINERGSLIALQREHLGEVALEGNTTHILWIDSDMKFPPNIVHRMISHDLPVVACNYVKRKIPAMPNTKKLNGKLMPTNRDSKGLEEAGSTGFGMVLMKREVLENLPQPWFDTVWIKKPNAKKPEMVGEDVFFFKNMRHHTDYNLWIDHDASQDVSHIGTFEYQNALCAATWEEVDHKETKEFLMG